MTVSPHDRTRIAAAAAVYVQTVARAYAGHRIRSTVRARIEAAARKLGLPLPPSEDPSVPAPAGATGGQP